MFFQIRSGVTLLLAGAAMASPWAQTAFATETRSYVVSWSGMAMHSQEGDCPGGVNPDIEEAYRRALLALGKNRAEVNELMQSWQENGSRSAELVDLMNNRGRIDGKPVNAYAHPEAVKDPQLKSVQSKYGRGFDLDGKATPEDFEEPDTGQKGIDNELFRALGCSRAFRGTLTNSATYSTWLWSMMKDSMPGWLITISGEDLSKDGEVTISVQKALEHVKFNADGSARAHMTYRADPDPRWNNVFRAQLKDGVVSIIEPGDLRLFKDPLSHPELKLKQTRMRLALNSDGTLEGLMGGFQPWRDIYFGLGLGGMAQEVCITGDIPGIYYQLKKHADAYPDETGQNTAISVAYQVKAVPAFVVPWGDAKERKSLSARN